MGYNSENTLMLANYETINGTPATERIAQNVDRTGTATFPATDVKANWRVQNKLYEQAHGSDGAN